MARRLSQQLLLSSSLRLRTKESLPSRTHSTMSPELNEEFKHLRVGMQFKPDIEDEATKAFQQIYTQVVSIEEAIEMLKRLKSSKNPREQQIFACMLRNLFDEYRFFPKYPDKELRITGILFGSLIQHQLVSFQMLGMTLRYVLEALRKPANTKMFKFGLYALQQFKLRLGEWPQVRQYYDTHHCSSSLTHSLARSAVIRLVLHALVADPTLAPVPSRGGGLHRVRSWPPDHCCTLPSLPPSLPTTQLPTHLPTHLLGAHGSEG